MTTEHGREIRESAKENRNSGNFVEAGDNYIRASYEYLGKNWTPTALLLFLTGGTCYLLGNADKRCRNRCQQGILIAEDKLDRVMSKEKPSNFYDIARRGAWYEYIGDFRLLSSLVGEEARIGETSDMETEEIYESANQIYRDGSDPDLSVLEQENSFLLTYFADVANGVDFDLEKFYEMQEIQTEGTLTQWVDYKRKHLPDLLEELFEQGKWPVEK